jgi:hypothetical protein
LFELGQVVTLLLGLGLEEDLLHPVTKAMLVTISTTSLSKQPLVGPWQLKRVGMCNAPVGLCFLYVLKKILNASAWYCFKPGLSSINSSCFGCYSFENPSSLSG